MDKKNIEEDVLQIQLKIDDEGDFQVSVGHNIDEEDYETEELEFFNDLLNGISFSINFGMEQLAAQGTIMRKLADYTDDDDDDEDEVNFEPDPELIKAMHDRKVVPIKKKFH